MLMGVRGEERGTCAQWMELSAKNDNPKHAKKTQIQSVSTTYKIGKQVERNNRKTRELQTNICEKWKEN